MEEYRCFVGGLAWSINSRSLEEAFRPYGDVVDCRVVSDRDSGRSRGFGFVTFGDEQGMRDAIEALNGTELDGRNIVVNQAQSRGGGGFRGGGGAGIRSGGYGAGFGNRAYGNGNGPREYDSERKNNGGFGAGYGGGRRGGRGGGRYGGRGGGGGDAGNSWK